MNAAEKIASTYLRLNGFLLLPHFTTFNGDHHGHIDLIGLRAAQSSERVGDTVFPIDAKFFELADQVLHLNARSSFVGVVVEVKTQRNFEVPLAEHMEYIRSFLGTAAQLAISFSRRHSAPAKIDDAGTIGIGLTYAFRWLLWRFDWMDENRDRLTKDGSWTLSEDFLSDILVLRQYELLAAMPVKKRHRAAIADRDVL